MKAACLLTGAVTVPLVLSATLSAQTLPLPTLPSEAPAAARPGPPDEGPAPEAGATGVPTGTRPRPWEYGLGLGAGWESNIDFRVPDGPSGTVLSPRGSLARVFLGPRGQLRLGGAGSWLGYPHQNGLSRYYGDVSLDGSYRSSLNTTWRASASYGLGYSDSSQILADQGVLLPLAKTQTLSGTFGVTRNLGPRTSLRLDGRIYRTEFDQGEGDAVGLVDGQSLRGTAGLGHRLGARDTVALEYSLENVLGRELSVTATRGSELYYLTHYGSLQWSHLLSPRHGFLLEAGASYTPEAVQVGLGRSEGFFGGVSYHRRVGPSSVTLFARREVTPAFGLGVSRLDNRFGLSASIPMGRAWTFRAAAIHVIPETPEGAQFTYGTPDEASVVLARRLGRHFQMSSEAGYRRRGASGASPMVEAFQAALYFSLVSPS